MKEHEISNNFEILDAIIDSMAVINISGDIIFTNKAWRSFSVENRGDDLYTGANNNYFSNIEMVEGEEIKIANDAKFGIQQVIDKKLERFELEYPCHSPSESRWFILRASQIITHPELTLLAHINITNRKNAELEIEKNYTQSLIINERLNTTLYKIVHDIQNPLSGIIGLIDLSKSERDINTLNDYLKLIEESCSNLSTFVIETLSHLSKSDESQSIHFGSMIHECLDTVDHLLKLNGIHLKLDV